MSSERAHYSPWAWSKPLEGLGWRHLIGDCARIVNGGRLILTRISPTPPWVYVGRMTSNPSCCVYQAVVAAISFHRARLSALRDRAKLPQQRRRSRNVKCDGWLKPPLNANGTRPISNEQGVPSPVWRWGNGYVCRGSVPGLRARPAPWGFIQSSVPPQDRQRARAQNRRLPSDPGPRVRQTRRAPGGPGPPSPPPGTAVAPRFGAPAGTP